MKALLFLNGPLGWQTGIEDGFNHLLHRKLDELQFLYFNHIASETSEVETLQQMSKLAQTMQPNIIVFFHIGKFKITNSFMLDLKNIDSAPIIVYDEGDMYGSWAKPITKSMKTIMRYADVVSIRGLGAFAEEVYNYNKCVIYTPHHADIARFDTAPHILETREYPICLIGNRIKGRNVFKKRLPGAIGREKFVVEISQVYGAEFYLFGNGWNGFKGNQGPVDFQKQIEIYKNSWITIAYEHYPEIPYYFSNRLPMALLSGSLYVCHYHGGYENIFKNCDFIFFFQTNQEAIDIIRYIQSLDKQDILARARRAREFALKYFSPEVIWENFFNNAINLISLGHKEVYTK